MSAPAGIQTRFGRRITLLFILCALGPVIVMAVLGYVQVRRQLLNQSREQLDQAAKNVGMGMIDQMSRAREGLERGDSAMFGGFWLVQSGRLVRGHGPAPDSIRTGSSAPWRLELRGEHPASVWLVRRTADGSEQWAALRHEFLFAGASERAFAGPREATFCLTEKETGRRILCPAADDEPGPHVEWDVFLRREFDTPTWTVTLAVPQSAVLQPVRGFRQTFLATIALVLGLVLFLSSRLVRRSMRPLIQLRRGTERFAAGDLSTKVEVNSGDEFDDLAASFNAMTAQVGGLIDRLDQLSYGALQALARTIDASSPWTAGHSERVTALSLAIGRRAGLSERDLGTVRRGALLHDIGKIGIEPRIIDKPGALTPEELRQIREHPRLGVRILAPLDAFRDALVIVESHHEKMDGTGYPAGLTGHDIPMLARLVAVADVYDALVSPRPYRPGWAQADAIAMIRAARDAHFDPDFVEHFLAVMRTEGDAARFQLTSAA